MMRVVTSFAPCASLVEGTRRPDDLRSVSRARGNREMSWRRWVFALRLARCRAGALTTDTKLRQSNKRFFHVRSSHRPPHRASGRLVNSSHHSFEMTSLRFRDRDSSSACCDTAETTAYRICHRPIDYLMTSKPLISGSSGRVHTE